MGFEDLGELGEAQSVRWTEDVVILRGRHAERMFTRRASRLGMVPPRATICCSEDGWSRNRHTARLAGEAGVGQPNVVSDAGPRAPPALEYRRDLQHARDAVAWLRCEADQFVEVGDHVLVLARVIEGAPGESAEPMTTLYAGWT